jgi:hypothetical protein
MAVAFQAEQGRMIIIIIIIVSIMIHFEEE